MKKIYRTIYYCLLISVFFHPSSFSQTAPEIEWQKSFGGTNDDKAYSIFQTIDAGYIVAGNTYSINGDVSGNHGGMDFWVVKIDSAGLLQWQTCLGGSQSDAALSIQQISDGKYIVAGSAYSNDSNVSGNHGQWDIWIVKLNELGTIEWQKCLGGSERDFANCIKQTSDSGFIVAGFTYSNDGNVTGNHSTYTDYWVVKIDSSGTIQWQKCFGGTDYDEAYSIQQTLDDGYIVAGGAGSNNGDVTGNHGNRDYWVIKLDSIGTIQWQKCLGGTGGDIAYCVKQTLDGGYVVCGITSSNDGDVSGNNSMTPYADSWIVKLDSAGNIQWQKCLGGTDNEAALSIYQSINGGFIIGGNTASNNGDVSGNHGSYDYWIVSLDSIGNILWQKCLGGSDLDEAYSIQQTIDNGFIIAGNSASNDSNVTGNHGSRDYWIVKLAPDTITSIPQLPNSQLPISISPNPFTDKLNVIVNNRELSEIILYDIASRKILQQKFANSVSLNTEQLAKGLYLYEVRIKDASCKKGKLVKD